LARPFDAFCKTSKQTNKQKNCFFFLPIQQQVRKSQTQSTKSQWLVHIPASLTLQELTKHKDEQKQSFETRKKRKGKPRYSGVPQKVFVVLSTTLLRPKSVRATWPMSWVCCVAFYLASLYLMQKCGN